MQGEPTIAEASCPVRGTSPRGECDTVEVLFTGSSSTDCEAHLAAIETEFDPCEVRTEPVDSAVVSSASTADVVVVADTTDSGRGSVDIESLRAQSPDCRVLGFVEDGSSVELAHSSLDEILPRPVSSADLVDAVGRLLRRRTYDELVQERMEIASELAALEAVNTVEELETDTQYTALSEEMAAAESACAALSEEFNDADFDALFQRVER